MKILYAREPFGYRLPRPWVFLAGPTCRNLEDYLTYGWRAEAVRIFDTKRFTGTLIIPEDEDFGSFAPENFDSQVTWEWDGLDKANSIMFWVPRHMDKLPGMTTNVEFGMYAASGKVVLGYPSHAENMSYMTRLAHRYSAPVRYDLADTVSASIAKAMGKPLPFSLS